VQKSPDPTDRHVGARVRKRRRLLEMSQTALADALGITFQQVQKYENGTNRVSASRLQQISSFLQVPISFFFDGLPEPPNKSAKKLPPRLQAMSSSSSPLPTVSRSSRPTLGSKAHSSAQPSSISSRTSPDPTDPPPSR
jgi:transcriptional regulator with XRE-family HTH domain